MTVRSFVVAGAGGVGKTTISAAIAAALADDETRALVLTVDPARRLADALGVDLSNEPAPVSDRTNLWAAMLDVSTSWEAIVHHYATPEVADRLLVNPFFRAIADRFPAAQSFAAAEQMAEYIESGHWDVVVIDTPPSGGGIDFFLAPGRMGDLIGGKLLMWLTGARLPGRRMLYRLTARPMFKLTDAVLGGPLLEDVAEFLLDLRTMYDALAVRSKTIRRHLAQATTLLVTTADPTPMRETRRFFEELQTVDAEPTGVVFNRALPTAWVPAARSPLNGIADPEVRGLVRENLKRWGGEARRQADARDELASHHAVPVATIPWMAEAPTTVTELLAMLEVSPTVTALLAGT